MKFSPKRNAGVTMIELMVAVSLSSVVIVVLASMTEAGSRWSTFIQTGLSARHDGKVALDYLQRDVAAITPAEAGRSTFALVPETVAGPDGARASSVWIMLLSRPAATSGRGAIKAISYRLVYTDPMTPGGSYPRFALYRSEINAEPGSNNSFLRAADLHAGYWKEEWANYLKEEGGRALLDDYLLENVVDLKVTLHYRYRDASGTRKMGSAPADDEIHWTSDGFAGTGIPSGETPNTPVSVTLTLTVLRAHGVTLYETGAMPFEEIIEKEGITVSRNFPILANELF